LKGEKEKNQLMDNMKKKKKKKDTETHDKQEHCHSLRYVSSAGVPNDIYIYLIIAYCLLRQSPMSDITYIALIMSISDYHSNQPPLMVPNDITCRCC